MWNKVKGGTSYINGNYSGGPNVTISPARNIGLTLGTPTHFEFYRNGKDVPEYPNQYGELVRGKLAIYDFSRNPKRTVRRGVIKGGEIKGVVVVKGEGRVPLEVLAKRQFDACKKRGSGWYICIDSKKGEFDIEEYIASDS